MAISSGIDITSIERIRKVALNTRFLNRVFTRNELGSFPDAAKPAYAKQLACAFAAKEACIKAVSINSGFNDISVSWKDIEITNVFEKKPAIILHNTIKTLCKNRSLFLSVSYANDVAIALVVMN